MVILHIASIKNNPFNGVCVVVPQHVAAQSKFADIALININNEKVSSVENQLEYNNDFDVKKLPTPFCNPDLVVFHETYRVDYLKIAVNLCNNNIPYIIIPHGELSKEAQRKKWLKKKVANLLLFNRFINKAVAIQCLSEREKNATNFGKYKFIGTNGIDIPEIKKEKFNCNKTKFVYIGRLDAYHKGIDLLLDAVKLSKTVMRDYNCTLDIYGPDYKGRFLNVKAMIEEREISDIVALYHEISGDDKRKVLFDADIFMQTSRFEGMPMGILEAMSYGIPVLITEGTTLGEFVEENDAGWKCKTEVNSISKNIRLAIEEKNRYIQKSMNAREAVKSDFAWPEVSLKTINKYKELVKN